MTDREREREIGRRLVARGFELQIGGRREPRPWPRGKAVERAWRETHERLRKELGR